MKAYVIQTWREVKKPTCMGISEHVTVGTNFVSTIYIPNKLLIGYEEGYSSGLIIKSNPPFLGVQEIVDGNRKGEVKELELNDSRRGRINDIIDAIKNPPDKGWFLGIKKAKHYDKVHSDIISLIKDFYLEGRNIN